MALTFYYGSGSNFAWKVWLVLEHKQIPYTLKVLSFDKGETRSPEFLAVNPRGKVPTIDHDGFHLGESNAIAEYLEEAFPEHPLLPKEPKARARLRRIALEADGAYQPTQRRLVVNTLFKPNGDGDPVEIASAKEAIAAELDLFDSELKGDFFGDAVSLADFTFYPLLRQLVRIGDVQPQHSMIDQISPRLRAWMGRIEALPYFAKTTPPHWKK